MNCKVGSLYIESLHILFPIAVTIVDHGISICVDIGDSMQVMTNVRFKSVKHRVAPFLDLQTRVFMGSRYPVIAEVLRTIAISDLAFRKIFVRGLDYSTTEETLCAAFKVHEEIEDTKIVSDKSTGRSHGFGFITYKNVESTQSAVTRLSELIMTLETCNRGLKAEIAAFNLDVSENEKALKMLRKKEKTSLKILIDTDREANL